MPTTAQSIIREAQTALQDLDGIRWPASDLVRYLNRAQRDVQLARPDATAVIEPLALAAGHRQDIPEAAAALIDIPCNTGGRSITKVDVAVLDASAAAWRALPQKGVITHFMHDLRTPRRFDVYPPALDGTQVDIEISAYPEDVPEPTGDGKAFDTVTGDIGLRDQWGTALLSMVLHYAYAVDAQYGGNAGLSAAYLQKATALLGTQAQSSTAVAPKQ